MASLNGLGLTGWRMLVGRALELAQLLKGRIEALENCKVLNLETAGPSVVWWVLPKGRNAKDIFQRAVNGQLSPEKFAHYAAEVRRLFEKREKAMDPQLKPAQFHNSIGYARRLGPASVESGVFPSEDR